MRSLTSFVNAGAGITKTVSVNSDATAAQLLDDSRSVVGALSVNSGSVVVSLPNGTFTTEKSYTIQTKVGAGAFTDYSEFNVKLNSTGGSSSTDTSGLQAQIDALNATVAGLDTGGGGGGGGTVVDSGYDDPTNALWGTANALDMEFNTDDSSGALPSGYSWFNQGGGTFKQVAGKGLLYHPGASSVDMKGIVASTPAGAFTYTAKLSAGYTSSNGTYGGLVLRRSSDSKLYICSFYQTSTGACVFKYTSPTSQDSLITSTTGLVEAPKYFRFIKTSPSDYSNCDFQVSTNGSPNSWRSILSADFGFSYGAFNQIGIATLKGDTTPIELAFDWVRLR